MKREGTNKKSDNRLIDYRWGIPVPNDETQTIYVWLDAVCSREISETN